MTKGVDDQFVKTDINTLPTALYVKIDDGLGQARRVGRPPRLSDAELLTMAVAQVLLGVRSEARWLRFLPRVLPGAFPYLPGQSGYKGSPSARSSKGRRRHWPPGSLNASSNAGP